MSPQETLQNDPQDRKPYRTPQFRKLADAPPDDRMEIILGLALLLLDLRDLANELEQAVVKLSKHERMEAPRVAPVYRRTELTDAERARLDELTQRPPDDDTDWDSLISQRG